MGEQIRKRRLDLDLRQIDVAKIVGCDEMTVVNWEKGYATPRINHMPKVVEFLGFNPLQKCDTLSALRPGAETSTAHGRSFATWPER